MMSKLSRFSLILVTIFVLTAAIGLPSNTVYQAHQLNPVMSNADGSGVQLGVADPARTYRVIAYNWNPWATSQWAYIEYTSGQYGYAPVQQGYTVVATVKYNVLVICCGSLP